MLHRRLADTGPVSRACASTSRSIPTHLLSQVRRCNAKKNALSPAQRVMCLGVKWDSVTIGGTTVPLSYQDHFKHVKQHLARSGLYIGIMAATSTVIPLGLLLMRPLQLGLKVGGKCFVSFLKIHVYGKSCAEHFVHFLNSMFMVRVTRCGFVPFLCGSDPVSLTWVPL